MKGSKEAIRTARQLMKATFAGGKLDRERAKTIVRRLGEEKPRGYLTVLSAYRHMLRLELEKSHAVIESAAPLDGAMRDRVSSDLRQKYGGELTMDFRINADMIGGMRVRVGSDVWDGTVAGRLARLRDALG